MVGYQRKPPVNLLRLLQTNSKVKRADLISAYVDLYFDQLGSRRFRPRRLMTNTVNKRLERKDFNGPVILCDHAIQFLIECWRHDGGNIEVLAEIFPIHDRVVTGKTSKAKAIVGKVWVTTGSPEDLQELNKLRQENVSIKQENKRLRITEKLWLESEEKKRETARRISKATRGKKKRQ